MKTLSLQEKLENANEQIQEIERKLDNLQKSLRNQKINKIKILKKKQNQDQILSDLDYNFLQEETSLVEHVELQLQKKKAKKRSDSSNVFNVSSN
jgi:Zn-dependent M16 (insulinase) family peptidase